jgi:cytochrome d ubiquinol oxidase subunit II
MHLYDLPLVFVLVGLGLYVVLAGADFGAGFWQLTAGAGKKGEEVREHAHRSMSPVWEANHVWLIFVLTVLWTAYPVAFGSIASTLSVALFVAGLGIVFRGAAYALRSGTTGGREQRRVDTAFALSSLLTPFALGAALGGVASRRVPVGNAAGHLFSSWLNPTSLAIGVMGVATGTYLAAVYLSADARRLGEADLERRFRARALGAGVVTGALAVAGIVVLHSDAHRLYAGLVEGEGLPALVVSALAGLATLVLVYTRRFELARYGAVVAVGAIVAGWGLAQYPNLLPGLTVRQAAASHEVLVAVVIAVLVGAALLFPSLGTLFRLVLRGHLDHARPEDEPERAARTAELARPSLYARAAAALLIAGAGLLNVADPGWAHAIGATCLVAFVAVAFRAALPLGGHMAGGTDGR